MLKKRTRRKEMIFMRLVFLSRRPSDGNIKVGKRDHRSLNDIEDIVRRVKSYVRNLLRSSRNLGWDTFASLVQGFDSFLLCQTRSNAGSFKTKIFYIIFFSSRVEYLTKIRVFPIAP